MMTELTKESGTIYYAMTDAIVHEVAHKFASATVTLASGYTVDQSWFLHGKWIYRLDHYRENTTERCYGTNDPIAVAQAKKEVFG